MKKLLSVWLLIVMGLNALNTAWASDHFNAEGYPIVNEPVTLSVFGCSATGQADWNEMSFFTAMERITGVKLAIEMVDASVFNEKLKIRIDGENYPDIILGGQLSDADIVNYGSRGILLPLNGLIERYAPNLKTAFETIEGLKEAVTAGDGNIYSLFYLRNAPRASQYCFWINADWLDAIGYSLEDVPRTLEEFEQMLRLFRDMDYNRNGKDDEIPLEIRDRAKLRALIMNAYGVVFDGDGFYADADGKAEYQFTSDAYRKYLAFASKLFNEKLLDNDMFSISSAQLVLNSTSNLVGVMDSPLPTTIYRIKQDEEDIFRYPMLNTLTGGDNTLPVKNRYNPVTKGLFSITSSCIDPEAAIRWIDHIYSYDGSMMMWQGAEGTGYAYLDRSRTLWKALVPEGMGAEEFRRTQTPACGSEMPFMFFDGMLEGLTNIDELYSDGEARKHVNELVLPFPPVSFTVDESREMESIQQDVQTYLNEMEAKFISGRLPINDENWQEYVTTIGALGALRLQEIRQAALDRYNEQTK